MLPVEQAGQRLEIDRRGGHLDVAVQGAQVNSPLRELETDFPQVQRHVPRVFRRHGGPPPRPRSGQAARRRPPGEPSPAALRELGQRRDPRGCRPLPHSRGGGQRRIGDQKEGGEPELGVGNENQVRETVPLRHDRARHVDELAEARFHRPARPGQIRLRLDPHRLKVPGNLDHERGEPLGRGLREPGGRAREHRGNLLHIDLRERHGHVHLGQSQRCGHPAFHGGRLPEHIALRGEAEQRRVGDRPFLADGAPGEIDLPEDRAGDPGPDLEFVPPPADPGEPEREGVDPPPCLSPALLLQDQIELRLLDGEDLQRHRNRLRPEGPRGFLYLRQPGRDLRRGVGPVPVPSEQDLGAPQDELRELRPPGQQGSDRHPHFHLGDCEEVFPGMAGIPGNREVRESDADRREQGKGEPGEGDFAACLLLHHRDDA